MTHAAAKALISGNGPIAALSPRAADGLGRVAS